MSTRCEILIKETFNQKDKETLKLYHHFDGYPSGVGKFLIENVLPRLRKSNYDVSSIANFLIKNKEDDTFEITYGRHLDIEYFYEINLTKKEIECWKARYKQDKNSKYRLHKIQEEDLTKYIPLKISEVYA